MTFKDISFDVETKTEQVGGKSHCVCEILLKYGDDYLDPDENIELSKIIRQNIAEKYWNIVCEFCFQNKAVVKISGIHFNVNEFLDSYSHAKDSANNLICHFHRWRALDEDAIDEEKFVLIECSDMILLKKLFEEYWFCIGAEWHTEIIILKDDYIAQVELWSRRDEGDKKYNDLLDMSMFLFDNSHNGFHCKAISNKENEAILANRLKLHK